MVRVSLITVKDPIFGPNMIGVGGPDIARYDSKASAINDWLAT
jgi:hypothetical protein